MFQLSDRHKKPGCFLTFALITWALLAWVL